MTSTQSIEALVHVFGSVSGYTTLACDPSISPADREALELLGFGQTDDLSYLSSLDQLPVALGRSLPSGRYAITRCFLGQLDSAGRTTLRFVSLVVNPEDWVDRISTGLWSVLNDSQAWTWIDSSSPTRARVKVTPSEVDPEWRNDLIALLSGWLHARITKSVGACRDQERSRRLVALLPCLLPRSDRIGFRWGIGLLAPGPVADVCTLSPIAETSSRRPIVWLPSLRLTVAPYAAAISHFWRAGAAPPVKFVSSVASCFSFDAASSILKPAQSNPVEAKLARRSSLLSAAIVAALIGGLSLAVVGGILRGRYRASNPISAAHDSSQVADNPSTQPSSSGVDTAAPEASASMEEHASNSDTEKSSTLESTSPATAPTSLSSADVTPSPPSTKPEGEASPFSPIENKTQIPPPTQPTDSPKSKEQPTPLAGEASDLPSKEILLENFKAAVAAARDWDQKMSVAFQTKERKAAPLDDLLVWDATLRSIEAYNERDKKVPLEQQNQIVFGTKDHDGRAVVRRVIAASVEKHALDLVKKLKKYEEPKQTAKANEPSLLDLEKQANQFLMLHPDGLEINNVIRCIRDIRKKR